MTAAYGPRRSRCSSRPPRKGTLGPRRARHAAADGRAQADPTCDPVNAAFEVAADEFPPLLVERPLARAAGRAWQLDWLAEAADRIAAEVRAAPRPPARARLGLGGRIRSVLPETSS